MDVHVRLTRRGDLSMQIYRQQLEAVLDGRLRPGERLPPTRELARRLEVSRNTVGVAYERLVADGVVAGRAGAGSFVGGEPLRRAQSRRAPAGAVHPRDGIVLLELLFVGVVGTRSLERRQRVVLDGQVSR